MLGDGGQFVDQGVEDAVELGMHGGGVGYKSFFLLAVSSIC